MLKNRVLVKWLKNAIIFTNNIYNSQKAYEFTINPYKDVKITLAIFLKKRKNMI